MTLKISNLRLILGLLESKGGKIVGPIDYGEVLRTLKADYMPLLMAKGNESSLFHLDGFGKEPMREKAKYEEARNEYESPRENS